jgi:CTP synthase (UTP-ammonia lyase)
MIIKSITAPNATAQGTKHGEILTPCALSKSVLNLLPFLGICDGMPVILIGFRYTSLGL